MSLLTSLVTLGGWAIWTYIVLEVDPDVPVAQPAFYATLFVALTGTFAKLLCGTASAEEARLLAPRVPNLGHAAVVSVLVLFALWLQSLRTLTPLIGGLLAATFVFIELGVFLTSRGRRRSRARRRPGRSRVPGVTLVGE